MTKISLQDVKHLANLSSLELSEEEAESLRIDMDSIVNYIEQLSTLDTSGVEPTYQVTNLQNIWRSDEVIDYGIGREELISLSSDRTEDSVRVPKVL